MSESISPDTVIGQYRVISKIGEGGMGEVYRARDEKLNRDVAIKVLPATLSQDAERLRRFVQVNGEGTFESGPSAALCQTRVPPSNFTAARNNYIVAADGPCFLVNDVVEGAESQPIKVVLNWTAQLKK